MAEEVEEAEMVLEEEELVRVMVMVLVLVVVVWEEAESTCLSPLGDHVCWARARRRCHDRQIGFEDGCCEC